MKKEILISLIFFVLLVTAKSTMASSFVWTGNSSVNWSVGGNWTVGGSTQSAPPTINDDVTIPSTSRAPTVNVASVCRSITITGTVTLTLSAKLTVGSSTTGTINVSSGGLTIATGSGSAITASGAVITSALTTFTIGASNTLNCASVSLGQQSGFTNNGTILTAGNFTIGPIVSPCINTGTITESSGTFNIGQQTAFVNTGGNINVTGIFNITTVGSYTSSGNLTVSGAATIGQQSPFISSAGTCTFSSTLTITTTGYITNAGTISVAGKLSIGQQSYITNSSTASFTAMSDVDVVTTGYITNAHVFSIVGDINLGQQSYISNATTGKFTTTGDINIVTTGYILNAGTFDSSTCAVSLGQQSFIRNLATGTYYLYDNASVSFVTTAYVDNAGIFYAGKPNKSCKFVLNTQQCFITNSASTGKFYLGSISEIDLTGINAYVSNTAGGTFTLMSDQYGSATIGTVSATATGFLGTYNVQRYFPKQASGTTAGSTRSYRLLSSPVNVNTIGNTLNSGATAYYNLQYLSTNSGGITGAFTGGPTGTAGGFTVTNATPTIYIHEENLTASNSNFSTGNFKGITNISVNGNGNLPYYTGSGVTTATTKLYAGNGFLMYYVGNNTANTITSGSLNKQTRVGGSYIAPDTAVVTAIGTLNQGNVPVRLWWNSGVTTLSSAKTGFNLVGNPYASTIDWNTTLTGGISFNASPAKTIYVFNYSNRNYGVYTASTGGTTGTNNASHLIASGQAFFVVASASTNSLTFTEAAKTSTQPASQGSTYLLMGAPVATTKTQLLRIKLAQDYENTDDIIVLFAPDAKNGYEQYIDADRIDGMGNTVSLASYASNAPNMLAINHMHSIDSTTRIKLYVNVLNSTGVDTLSGSGFETLDPRYDAWLIDHYKKDSLFFSKYQKYLFNINNPDTTSFGANRFEIVFRKKSSLNYRLLNFTATPVKGGIQLNWKTESESNLTGFQIQRQDGSKIFVALSSMQSDSSGSYNYIDKTPYTGMNYYRLQQDDPFGEISYSEVVAVNTGSTGTVGGIAAVQPLSLYPNPVTSMFNVKINGNVPGRVLVTVTNQIGQAVINRVMDGSNIQQAVNNLLQGPYQVQVVDDATKQVVGTAKFIKQ